MLLSGSGQWCPVGLPFKDGVAKANDAHGFRVLRFGMAHLNYRLPRFHDSTSCPMLAAILETSSLPLVQHPALMGGNR
ncbi:hypothetical protein P5673_018957 [Acropora cervicornis]|uniref:Uncharacterized protein n=1 Tax=Acropora cervicornis TaxID=6130 RepID=A0AAD9QCK0_ACRCE|nr:hypothetical protein P5673_018957 [Acropora cervicornis]